MSFRAIYFLEYPKHTHSLFWRLQKEFSTYGGVVVCVRQFIHTDIVNRCTKSKQNEYENTHIHAHARRHTNAKNTKRLNDCREHAVYHHRRIFSFERRKNLSNVIYLIKPKKILTDNLLV